MGLYNTNSISILPRPRMVAEYIANTVSSVATNLSCFCTLNDNMQFEYWVAKKQYYWPGMAEEIKEYVQICMLV